MTPSRKLPSGFTQPPTEASRADFAPSPTVRVVSRAKRRHIDLLLLAESLVRDCDDHRRRSADRDPGGLHRRVASSVDVRPRQHRHPVYEELVFRGLMWNRLATAFTKPWIVYTWSVLLLGVWHLGHFDSVAYRVEIGLMPGMVWKAITGVLYGVVLSALRLKTRNCYSTMLLHGVLNLFGRWPE